MMIWPSIENYVVILIKVLQSEFLNAVREVYEHIYETVDVEGT